MDDREALVNALRRFFERAPAGIVAAYLFGGRASGRVHAESDIDVGVVLDRQRYPEKAGRSRLRVELAGALMAHLAADSVDLVVLNDAPPELGRAVVQAGIRVFAAEAGRARAYERDVQLRAADLDPALRRARESLLRRYVVR